MADKDLVEVTGEIYAETEKAIMFSDDGERGNAVWLPRSQIEIHQEGEKVTIVMPEWLAKEKEFV
jgi:hypothetical protein